MRRLPARAWAFLGEYPLTVGGAMIGLTLAVFLWTGQQSIRHDVQRIERRVIVVERNDRDQASKQRSAVCVVSRPNSPGCKAVRKQLGRAITHLSEKDRRALLEALRPKSGRGDRVNAPAPISGGAPKPSAPRPGPSPLPTPGRPAAPAPAPSPVPPVKVHVHGPPPVPDVDVEVQPKPLPAPPTPPVLPGVVPDQVQGTVEDAVGHVQDALPDVPPLP